MGGIFLLESKSYFNPVPYEEYPETCLTGLALPKRLREGAAGRQIQDDCCTLVLAAVMLNSSLP